MFIYMSTGIIKAYELRVCVFSAFWWCRATVVVLHRCSCPLCHRRVCAMRPLKSGQWCHSWEYSTHTYTFIWYASFFMPNYEPSPFIPTPLSSCSFSSSSPEIGLCCLLQCIHPLPAGGLSAIWRRAVWWLRLAGRLCGPSSGPYSQTDSGSQNAK